jgi:hypothetical protein
MAESTLSITRGIIRAAVGRQLGYAATTGNWSSETIADVNRYISFGERMFYSPATPPGVLGNHTWSFLVKVLSVTLAADDSDYTLADDFGGFVDNELYYATADDKWSPVRMVGVEDILHYQMLDQPMQLTQSYYGAVNPKTSDLSSGQRFELLLYPTPTATLTLKGRYYSNPEVLDDDAEYPLGGQPHAQTLMQACLAAAEINSDGGGPGTQYGLFQTMLAKSIAHDRLVSGKKFFGYNGDRSSGNSCLPWYGRSRFSTVEYDGFV